MSRRARISKLNGIVIRLISAGWIVLRAEGESPFMLACVHGRTSK
jgi:hypothetical protein